MESQVKNKGGFRTWLKLLRAPNLFTVPGDVLVGCAVAVTDYSVNRSHLLAALAASLCLYAAGLIMNDVVDEEADRRERPFRPIASGAISKAAACNGTAIFLGIALIVLGLQSIALLGTGALVGVLLFIYNMAAKRSRFAGSIVMGLCRSGSLLLGAVAVSPAALQMSGVYTAAILWFCFIAMVSWMASREMMTTAYGMERWIPAALIVVGGGFIIYLSGPHEGQSVFRSVFCFFFAMFLCYQAGLGLGVRPQMRTRTGRLRKQDTGHIYPKSIGLMISALVPMQAAVLILYADRPWILLAALLTLFCWPLNRLFARYIPAS